MRVQRGFTLMELLVVLLIIGVLSSVALRTIDATRDRGLFEQTIGEMKTLVHAIVGNADLMVNGRRTDFGFYGDMRRLPNDLEELVTNSTGSPDWNGPYLRREFTSDSSSYLYDAWGHPYTYDQSTGTIGSLANGRSPLTIRVADSLPQLQSNTVTGVVTDNTGSPPGELNGTVTIWLRLPGSSMEWRNPDPGGYYSFDDVPIGSHRIVAQRVGGDSIARWVSVAPRSRSVIDFRFSKPFRNYLRMVGEPRIEDDSAGFYIQVVNEGTTDDTIKSVVLLSAPDSFYMEAFWYSGSHGNAFQSPLTPRVGRGSAVDATPDYAVLPERGEIVAIGFSDFYTELTGGTPQRVRGRTFRLRFNDGSEITVTP